MKALNRSRLVAESQGNLIESQSYDSHHRSLTSQRAYGPASLSLTYRPFGGGQPEPSLPNSAFRIQHS